MNTPTVPRSNLVHKLRALGFYTLVDCFGGIRFQLAGKNIIVHANTKPGKRSPFMATHGFVIARNFLECAKAAKRASEITGIRINGYPKFGHGLSVSYTNGKLGATPIQTRGPRGMLP